MAELLDLISKTYGLAGVLILLPCIACASLWSDNKALRKELRASNADAAARIQECNDRIITSYKEHAEHLDEINDKLSELVIANTAVGRENTRSLDRLSEIVTSMRLLQSSSRG